MKFGIRDLLVLVEIGDRRVQLSRLRICLLRQLLRLTGLGAGLQSLLIGLRPPCSAPGEYQPVRGYRRP